MVRMTRKWLDDAGLPTCGCGGKMEEDGGEDDDFKDADAEDFPDEEGGE